jgi:Mg-chelatase subunit ChlD
MKWHGCVVCACSSGLLACASAASPQEQTATSNKPGVERAADSGTSHVADSGDFGSPNRPDASPGITPNDTNRSDAEPECGRQRFEVARKPADVLLVLDRSASMKDDVNGDEGEPSKWAIVVPALKEVISATDALVHWGLELFPLGESAGECTEESYPDEIAVPVQSNNASKVNMAIDQATPEGDGTPTGDAVDEAVNYLKTLNDGNRKYILLATDGEPSCTGSTKGGTKARPAATTAVTNAAAAGFNTFVVGIATTKESASETLTALGQAGGQAPPSGYYLASSKDELVRAMSEIAGSVATCRFPLVGKPPNPDHVGVLIGADKVAKDPASKNGWNYIDSDMTAIEVFGAPCDLIKQSDAQTVTVVFGCREDELF